MTDATILIPTHRHAAFLPYSIESALDQEGASVEVFVVGDGVEEATREVVARYSDEERLRYFDRPKGPRLGEAYRHAILDRKSTRLNSSHSSPSRSRSWESCRCRNPRLRRCSMGASWG